MSAVERLLAVVRAEVGYLEKASNANLDDKTANVGSGNYTKYARDLDALGDFYNTPKNGFAWCDVFVDWCFVQAFGAEAAKKLLCQPDKSMGAGCTQSAGYYRAKGRFYTADPQAGDQIFYTRDGGKSYYHTGIVTKVENGKVHTIEGNTSSAAGVVENGGAVAEKSYSLGYSNIGGYGRPDFSSMEETEMTAEQVKRIAKEAAAEIVQAYRETLQDNDAGNYSAEARKWAVENGIFNGGGTLPDGTPNYMWQDFITREQAATILYRFAQQHGLV